MPATRAEALDLIERVNEINPEAAEYLLQRFQEVPPGETEVGRPINGGYRYSTTIDGAFTWRNQPQGGSYWSSLDMELHDRAIHRDRHVARPTPPEPTGGF